MGTGTETVAAAHGFAPLVGLVEWFRPGEHDRVEQVIEDCQALGIRHLRTAVSWADWCTPEGQAWFDWLLPRLAGSVVLLPCFHYTPPSLGLQPRTSSPPRDPALYAAFVRDVIDRFGDAFEWVELWNEPNNGVDWDAALDPEWTIFGEMIRGAAAAARERGKRVALGGMCPIDPVWLEQQCAAGVLRDIGAVGIHGYPGTWEFMWASWDQHVAQVRRVLASHDVSAEVWISEAGFSTWSHDERGQIRAFVRAAQSPVERMYWTSVHDLAPSIAHRDGFHADERHYHLGLKRADGTPKLLFRLWAGSGLSAVRHADAAWMDAPARTLGARPALITGGAGFIGCNLADRLLSNGRPVIVFDNLARPGVEDNLKWLCGRHGNRVQVEMADVRDAYALTRAARHAGQVFHLAAQVAVTTSLTNAVADFEINARGTLNLLEALRALDDPPPVVFTSTNKVYGALDNLALVQHDSRYEPSDPDVRARGVDESRPLDFHSPYGCSKGAADQYVLDYARTFGLPAVVFRMSCIYGPHQCGTEDQGWVAHFGMNALSGQPITLYGDGMQVRDVLFVEDLVNAFLAAQDRMDTVSGQAFNIGGGPSQAVSLLEVLDLLAELTGRRSPIAFRAWRPGDQRYYVSDVTRFSEATGWRPRVGVREGVSRLLEWLTTSTRLRGVAAASRLAS